MLVDSGRCPSALRPHPLRMYASPASQTDPNRDADSDDSASTCTTARTRPLGHPLCRPSPALRVAASTAAVEALTRLPLGLVLVGGPPAPARRQTLAALVERVNLRDARHIITIEDPSVTSIPASQVVIEPGWRWVDAPDFPDGAAAALRPCARHQSSSANARSLDLQIAVAAGETAISCSVEPSTDRRSTTVARIADSFPVDR